MKNIILLVLAIFTLTACKPARFSIANSLSENGVVAIREERLGRVWRWLPEENRAYAIALLKEADVFTGDVGRDVEVSFSSEVKFEGGADLSEAEVELLKIEVANRASAILRDSVRSEIESTVSAVIDDFNRSPTIWRQELGVTETGWPSSENPIYIAVVNKVTLANSGQFKIDNNAYAGAEFSAESLANANLKVEVIDAGEMNFSAPEGERSLVYYDFEILEIYEKPTGNAGFRYVQSASARERFAQFLLN